jgi:2-pyrone-4,6-dicarboxylate lactonase
MIEIPASAPLCAPPDPQTRRPRITVPAGACDCHAHICGPMARHAYAPERIYTPPDALPPQYRAMLATLGVSRAVLVQPSVYGTDNSVMVEALGEPGFDGRGVAVVAPDISDAALQALHAAGVRGVRINIVDVKQEKNIVPREKVRRLAERIAPLGWHIEFLMQVDAVADIEEVFADFPVDIVLGHLGYLHAERGGPEHPGFQALLRLLAAGSCWVKLTGPYRISNGAPPYADTRPFADALVATAPDRLVWGSDWPHVMVKKHMPNDGDLMDLLGDWTGDATLLRRILVDNPAALYGFAQLRSGL